MLAALLHTRPRSWPIVAAHMATGYLATTGLSGVGHWLQWLTPLLGGAVLWAVFLNGGTLALNSAVDRDTDDVGYLDAPPPPPGGLAPLAVAWMFAGLTVAWLLHRAGVLGFWFIPLYAANLGLSILYSVPPIRLKARAGLDLLVNGLGYGSATFLAGWAASGLPLVPAVAWAGAGFGFLFACLYPLTQLYQMEGDAAQGVRTLAVRLGRRASVVLSLGAALCAFVALTASAALHRAQDRFGTAAQGTMSWWAIILFLTLALVPWVRLLLPLLNEEREAGKEVMYRGLRAWAVTDLVVILLLA